MALYYDFIGSAKPISATTAQTLTWAGNDLPGSRLALLFVSFEAAGNTLADLDRVVLKADNEEIINLTTAQLLAFNEQTFPSNRGYATSLQTLTIPLMDMLEDNLLAAELQQFPPNTTPQLELFMNTGTAAGNARVGWALSDIQPNRYPKMISRAHAQGTTVNNGRMAFTTRGSFRGFSFPAVGTKRLRCVHNGRQALHLPGVAYVANSGDMRLEAARFRGAMVTTVDPIWAFLERLEPANPGQSWLEMDLDTAAANGEVAIYESIPLGV